jgi:Na+-driven multidrug efflux pump
MPIFLSNIAGRVTSITMNVMLLSMGGQRAISVYGVLMYVGETLQPLVYGICDSVQPAIGYNWGAKRLDRTRALARYCFISAAAVSCLSAGLMLMIPEPLVRLFTTGADPEFISLGVFALRIYGTSKLLQWFSFAAQSYMTAVEKMKYATVLSLASAVVFPMIFIFALYPLGLTGLWLNATATMLFCGVLSAVILYKFKKETAVTVPCDAGAADDD